MPEIITYDIAPYPQAIDDAVLELCKMSLYGIVNPTDLSSSEQVTEALQTISDFSGVSPEEVAQYEIDIRASIARYNDIAIAYNRGERSC